MKTSRRCFLQTCGALGAASVLAPAMGQPTAKAERRYHLSVSPDALEADAELLELVRRAGVTDIWLTGFLYGHWNYPLEKTRVWRQRVEQQGMAAHLINVPLGHPGDALGSISGNVPITPPRSWRGAVAPNGAAYVGTSLHPPATQENCEAMRRVEAAGIDRVFLDDDFRLARSPGTMGGCFCAEHKREFLQRTGYHESRWQELLEAVEHRRLTPVLKAWVDFTCDQLTACFRAQQRAAPRVQLGIMVMYFGAEKAGIRLADYRDVPFRVGELMFDDASFDPLKGKTNELFSALFHRRFARPELAFSETTAFPANRLSAANMAAKLAVSTISDVRNTMYMSGLTAFPRDHWQILGPAMKWHAKMHSVFAGHVPRGPLKHFWGEASRYVGDDNPYSLFLALGIPFKVTGEPAADGFTFLSDADAQLADSLRAGGTKLVGRPHAALSGHVRGLPETLPALLAWKREIVPHLQRVPYVEGDTPVVCAWYPTARAVLLWNLSPRRESLVLRCGEARRSIEVAGLDAALVENVGV